MKNNKWESIKLENFNVPYNSAKGALDNNPRLVYGSKNTLVRFDGTLGTRSGLSSGLATCSSGRIDRMWYYETLLPMTGTGFLGQYVLASVYKPATGRWSLFYGVLGNTAGSSANFIEVTALGEIRESTKPHHVVVVRGKAYVKMFPRTSASDKLGLYTWEMTAAGTQQVGYWGLLGPTVPAKVGGTNAAARRGYGAITASATSVVVTQQVIGAAVPAAPFTVLVDREEVTVTAISLNTPGVGFDTWTITRGVNGTTADAHLDGSIYFYRNFAAAGHNVSADFGWAYSYCWKNKNGQYSNRAPLQTNLDALPSRTGPLTRSVPKITVTCPTDTTEYPSILILRTTDGGGIFWPLTEIDNPGTATTTFEDKYFPSGSTAVTQNAIYDGPIYDRTLPGSAFADPVEDEFLTGQARGPGLTTNSPLPGVNAPKVVGTDTPTDSTQLVYWNNRIWVGVGNILYFTSLEELSYGIPEESCDTADDGTGNFFRFQEEITQIIGMKDYLLIFTRSGRILKLSGNLKETFVVNKFLDNIGFNKDHPYAYSIAEDKLFFLSRDNYIYMMDDNTQRIISHPISLDLQPNNLASFPTRGECRLVNFVTNINGEQYNWVVTSLPFNDAPSVSQMLVYDLYKSQRLTRNYSDNIERSEADIYEKTYDFWNSPWTIPHTCVLTCPNAGANNSINRFFVATYNEGTTTATVRQYSTDSTVMANDGTTTIDWDFVANFNLFTVPPGYHVHSLQEPGVHPNLFALYLERKLYAPPDIDPEIGVFLDSTPDLFTATQKQLRVPSDQHRDQFIYDGNGYRALWGTINRTGKYFAPYIRFFRPKKPIVLHKMALVFDSGGGV